MRSYNKIKDKIEDKGLPIQFKSLGKSNPFYKSKEWLNLRRIKLELDPICEHIMCRELGAVVDHIRPIRTGGAKLDLANLQTLCKRHNWQKTGQQKGQKNVDELVKTFEPRIRN